MKRKLTCLTFIFTALTLIFPATLTRAQVVALKSDSPPEPEVPRKVKMAITPAHEPSPALKYELLPNLLDQAPGNAASQYHTAAEIFSNGDRKDHLEKTLKFLDMPLQEMPKDEVRVALDAYSTVLRQLNLAAHREKCDWDLPIRSEGFSMLLPSLGKFRNMSKILAVQARLQIAEGNYDAAIQTLQNGFALARHVAEGQTIIHNLVGIAIAQLMLNQIEEFVQAPDSPNLYWALTRLPSPFIDMNRALQWEKEVLFIEFPQLRDLDKQKLSPAQAQELWLDMNRKMSELLGSQKDVFTLAGIVTAMKLYPQAKQFLIAEGRNPQEVESLPVAQVILIYQLHDFIRTRDDIFKWLNMPFIEAREGLSKAEKNLSVSDLDTIQNPFKQLLPALSRINYLKARFTRSIAALRHVEAVRIYASAHDRRLPDSLDDITVVTLPPDPLSGNSFTYRHSDGKGIIESLAPLNYSPKDGLIYEIAIK
jgi:hypothetical protein